MDLRFVTADGVEVEVEGILAHGLLGDVLAGGPMVDFWNEQVQHSYRLFLRQLETVWLKKEWRLLDAVPQAEADWRREQWLDLFGMYVGAALLTSKEVRPGSKWHGTAAAVVWFQSAGEALFPERVRDLIRWWDIAEGFYY